MSPDKESGSARSKARAQADIEQAIRSFREDPERWREIRSRFEATKTDDEKVALLLDFATSEGELARMVPVSRLRPGAEPVELATVTTITITTVLVPDTAY